MVGLSYTPWPGIDLWSEEGFITHDGYGCQIISLPGYGCLFQYGDGRYETWILDTVHKKMGVHSCRLYRIAEQGVGVGQRLSMKPDVPINMNNYLGMHFWHLLYPDPDSTTHFTGYEELRLYSSIGSPEPAVLVFGTPENAWEEKIFEVSQFDFGNRDPIEFLSSIRRIEIHSEQSSPTATASKFSMLVDNFFVWRPLILNPILNVRAVDVDDGKPVYARVTLTSPLGLSNTYDLPFGMRVSPGVWTITLNDVNGVFLKWSDGDENRTKIVDIQDDTYLTGVYRRTGGGFNMALVGLGLAVVTVTGAVIILYPDKVKKLLGW